MRLTLLMAGIFIILLATASSNCLCIDFFSPPMQWYNYSYEPAPNVSMEIHLITLGPEPVTILPSDSGEVGLSVYTYKYTEPREFSTADESGRDIRLGLMGPSDVNSGIKTETLIYLPPGPNYTIAIRNGWAYPNESMVTNRYTGNLILLVNDPNDNLPGHPFLLVP